MSYSVGQVSAFAGVTVRTLHHYDKAGLLSPSDRSHAGYRLYSEADLVRLQQILVYRELRFPLEEIAAIFNDPQANPLERLRVRQRQLNEEIARLQRLAEVAERAMEVQKTGVPLTPGSRTARWPVYASTSTWAACVGRGVPTAVTGRPAGQPSCYGIAFSD